MGTVKNIKYPVINQGMIFDHGTGMKFIFRSFINQPLGWAYLYPFDKNEHVVNLEMEILNSEDRDMPVFFPAAKRAFPVFWDEDDLPQIATAELNIFVGILMKQLDLTCVEDAFIDDHQTMFELFRRHYESNEAERRKNNG